MASHTFASRCRVFLVLCAALILLSIAMHLMADVAWGSPYIIIAKSRGLQCPACYLLDGLALPLFITMLAPTFAAFTLSSPGVICRAWLPPPLVRPPLYAV